MKPVASLNFARIESAVAPCRPGLRGRRVVVADDCLKTARVVEAVNREPAHALLTHVAERHRWAGWVLGRSNGPMLAHVRAVGNGRRPWQEAPFLGRAFLVLG
jgi:hypothetical protein